MRKNQWLGVIGMSLAVIPLQGCAHGDLERKVQQKLAKEEPVNSQAELRDQAAKELQATPGISPTQREKLETLRTSTQTKQDLMREESLKLRALLIDDLLSPKYDSDEVNLIKSKIRKIEQDRVSLIFDAVDKVNKILGRDATANQEYVRRFFFIEGRGGGGG